MEITFSGRALRSVGDFGRRHTMVRPLLESTRIYHDGQLDVMRAILFGVPVIPFILCGYPRMV